MSVQLDCEGKEKSKMSAAEAAARYMSLINENYVGGTNIIFLPETAVHTEYSQSARAFAAFSGFAKASGCTVVTGCFFRESGKKYNSIIAFTPSGLAKGRYFKAHLVPFGEYAPLSLISRGSGLSSGTSEYEPIEIGNLRLGCGICIEAAYSELFRSETANGAQLIYIPTNDSWFGESYARHANYLHSKMRAIENSRYTVRSGNCGISAVIAPWGEEIAKTESRECAAISAQAKLIGDKNLYVSVGDSFMLLPLLLAVASVVRGGKKRINRQKKS
jgi:apolipoprotein N-acyltransferase